MLKYSMNRLLRVSMSSVLRSSIEFARAVICFPSSEEASKPLAAENAFWTPE
jgi:hypothetical protein